MITTLTHPIRALRCALSVLLLGLAVKVCAAPVAFDIPAQPAAEALDLFIKQSGANVVYLQADVQGVSTNAVKGTHEPAAALDLLLKNTVLVFTESKPNEFAVGRTKPGSVEGSVQSESGRPVAGAHVSLTGTKQMTVTDKRGRFAFEDMPAGAYALAITGEGIQNTKVTDVNVKVGHRLTLSAITVPVAVVGAVQLEDYIVSAKKNDGVVELDPVSVEGRREKPFTTANMDIPRTINDAQPYQIFDSTIIEKAGAVNLESFLKQHLTMNTMGLTNGQKAGGSDALAGNTSTINLRGLGADKTLVLINGRRVAGVQITTTSLQPAGQPDLNGIPLSAIDRIEILPTSASGIYGGSAIGGVINVVLKRDYSGGEVRATYDNTWGTDAPRRTLMASYGMALEDGKTHLMLNAQWSDSEPLLLRDRRTLYEHNLAAIQRNSPAILSNWFTPIVGSTPNITSVGGPQQMYKGALAGPNLVLKNGTQLNAPITSMAAGISSASSTADLYAGLVGNAGNWNLDLPDTTQTPTGLRRPFGATPKTRSFQASVRRQMLPNLEAFFEFGDNNNHAQTIYNAFPASNGFLVRITAPTNPFTGNVRVQIPNDAEFTNTTNSRSQSLSAGLIARLPFGWTGEFDYSWSRNRYSYSYLERDNQAIDADILSGALNPFVDTLLYPLNFKKYLRPQFYASTSTLDDFALRGTGPLKALPWGVPQLTLGAERRVARTPAQFARDEFLITTSNNTLTTFYPREERADSSYMELHIPLVRSARYFILHALELQLSGRSEEFLVDTGTPASITNSSGEISYVAPTVNGRPFFTKSTYTSANYTLGLKYQPLDDLTFRASSATAFLPPSPGQLLPNPTTFSVFVLDPKNQNLGPYLVQTLGGGNPNVRPQHSKSVNAGMIWEPVSNILKGLRVNVEYYRIQQFDAIDNLGFQQIVNFESAYPDRVTRNSSGLITQVDNSALNLYKRETTGWDFIVDYEVKTGIGDFKFHGVQSVIRHLKQQVTFVLPNLEYAGFPNEGGAAKTKSNVSFTWEHHGWGLGWDVTRFGSYKQYGAVGGPAAVHNNNGAADTTYILPQGSDTVSSQIFHGLFASYSFGKDVMSSGGALKSLLHATTNNLTVQIGVRNVFNQAPALDAYYNQIYYFSPYGDPRLRSYWVSLRKQF